MDTIIEIVGSLLLAVVAIVAAMLFTEMIEAILKKNRVWFSFLLLILGIMLAETAVYSWLPGRFGYKVEYFDGAFSLDDGAVLSNLGGILLAQAVALVFTLAKYLWSCIRKKESFNGKFFLLDFLFMLVFGAAAVSLFQNDSAIALTKAESVRTSLLLAFGVCGTLMILLGIHGVKKKY